MADDGNDNGGDTGSRELACHGSTRGVVGTRGGLHTHVGLAERKSQEESWERSRFKGLGRELNADLLVQVFSHLPQMKLFEVMLVSRDWEKAVIGGSGLWRKVEVVRKWDLGAVGVKGKEGMEGMEGMEWMEGKEWMNGRGPGILFQVLRMAENVRFSSAFDHDKTRMMVVGEVLGPNLRSLELPASSVTYSFFPLLFGNCPNLKSLAVEGELDDEMTSHQYPSLYIWHPRLETLRFDGRNPFSLSVECPSLLDLYFGIDEDDLDDLTDLGLGAFHAPDLECPKLTSLHLSNWYSTKGVLETMAAYAPDIKRLRACVNKGSPFLSLTHFKALRDLTLLDMNAALPPNAFAQLPNLERLELVGHGVSKSLKVALRGLRSLTLQEYHVFSEIELDCPVLEYLVIQSHTFEATWDEKCSCPRLKKLHVVWDPSMIDQMEYDIRYLYIHSEAIKEVVNDDLTYEEVVIVCEKLERLSITWLPHTEGPLRLPTADCPNLKSLELEGYPFMFPNIPSLLSALPKLEVLKIFCSREDVREVVLEHRRVSNLVITNCKETTDHYVMDIDIIMKEFELTLMMSSLLRVDVEKSSVRVLKMAARENAIVTHVTTEKWCNVIEMDAIH